MRRTAPIILSALVLLPATAFASWHHWHHWHHGHEDRRTFPATAALPDPSRTPGALNPAVTQRDIYSTICVRGWTRTVRPPESYTERLKREQIRQYGYRDRWLRDYEEDHLVPLELGGSPASPRNLWPEPHHVAGGWGSYRKDRLENRLNQLVCRGRITLAVARRAIARNWIGAYRRFMRR